MSAARLVGSWELVSYDSVEPDGSVRQPFGEAVGRLNYDSGGNMSGQVMRPDRPSPDAREGAAQQIRAAYTGYIAYFGTYDVNAAGDTVTHRVLGALNPAWIGGSQVRRMRFDGDLLILEADVVKTGGTARHVLTWRRF
jgi:lipocalin-like protein